MKGIVAQLNGLLAGAQAGCPGYQPVVENRTAGVSQYYRGVYLPSMTRGPALVHLLLLNGNGDLYQVGSLPHLYPSPLSLASLAVTSPMRGEGRCAVRNPSINLTSPVPSLFYPSLRVDRG